MAATNEPAASFYPARYAFLNAGYQRALRFTDYLQRGFSVLLVMLAMVTIQVLRGALSYKIFLALLIPQILLGVLSVRAMRKRDRLLRVALLYDAAVERITGVQTQSGSTGMEFHSETHLYEHDLGVLGTNSLFGMLDTTRTGVGQRGLASLLLGNCDVSREAILARREALQELAPQNDLRESIALLGESRFQQVSAAFLDRWLDQAPPEFHPAVRISLFLTTGTLLTLLLLGVVSVFPWAVLMKPLLCTFAVQGAIAASVRKRALPLLDKSSHLANQMQLFRDGLKLLKAQAFTSPKLLEMQSVAANPENAVRLLAKLHQQFTVVEQRTKEWFFIPSLLLCAGTHAAMSIAAWKRNNGASMRLWMAAWGEFEALNALGTFAYEHPDYAYPELLPEGTAIFEASALAHPLLSADAVSNDIALNSETRLYLISGSNMAGKSTLMRAIGINAVLANTGAPIRAHSARLSPLMVGASIALTDSLAEGRSKFLAEVERLEAILRIARDKKDRRVLFLIDEIFSGTNSSDRRIAAEAVAHALVEHGGIGALSTHDLTLTEMASSPELHAINVHMASPNADDPLAFDYSLKPGVNVSSNALAIVRMIGIEVKG